MSGGSRSPQSRTYSSRLQAAIARVATIARSEEALATIEFMGVLAIMVAVISRISLDSVRRWGVRGMGRT